MELRESTRLLEERVCAEILGIQNLPPDTTEEYAQMRYRTLSIVNDMLQDAYKNENEREKLEIEREKLGIEKNKLENDRRKLELMDRELDQKDLFEAQRKKEATRDFILDAGYKGLDIALKGARTGADLYIKHKVIDHECNADKIFPTSTSSRMALDSKL